MGIDINGVDDKFFTPLQMAAKHGHYEIVELLLNQGAEIDKFEKCNYDLLKSINYYDRPDRNEFNGDEFNALQWAVKHNHNDVVRLLLDKGADFREDYAQTCPLDLAAENNNQEAMELLFNTAAYRGYQLWTKSALNHTIAEDLIEPTRWLLEHGVSPAYEDGFSCFQESMPNIPMMELILSYDGTIIHDTNDDGLNSLQYAINSLELDVVKWLIAKGYQIDDDLEPIHCAIFRNGSADDSDVLAMLEFLDKLGLDFNKRDEDEYLPLHYVAMYSSPAILKYFLDKGFSIDTTDSQGNYLIHLAAKELNIEMVDYLINQGMDVNIKNKANHLLNWLKISTIYTSVQI